MIVPTAKSTLSEFEQVVYRETRARYDAKVVSCLDKLKRDPDNIGLRLKLARMLLRYVEDARVRPLVVSAQPDAASDVCRGKHEIGTVVDSGVRAGFSSDQASCGGLVIVAGPSRSAKSTLLVNLLRAFLE
jgi:hypothetical protein